MPILSLLIWLPIVAGVLLLLVSDDGSPNRARGIALFTILVSLGLCIPLIVGFDLHTYSMQFREQFRWIPQLGLRYDLGVDGISMPLIVLSTFTTLIVILATWHSIKRQVAQYMATILVMQGLLVGVFSALNGILFYFFWEASLVPMYLIIGIWGSDNRVYAAIKFFLYTFLGSVMLLVALLYLGFKAGSFDILSLYTVQLGMQAQSLLFFAFLLGFAIKVPMWPVHTWLPDAHTEAPAGGSIVLAAVLLKLGAYGFLRFSLPIVPDACRHYAGFMVILSLIAIVYIGFVAIVQKDMKKLVAYSSVSHMGFVTLAFFMIFFISDPSHGLVAQAVGLEGALVIILSHGFISGALFAAWALFTSGCIHE